jgi:hypothetical protein
MEKIYHFIGVVKYHTDKKGIKWNLTHWKTVKLLEISEESFQKILDLNNVDEKQKVNDYDSFLKSLTIYHDYGFIKNDTPFPTFIRNKKSITPPAYFMDEFKDFGHLIDTKIKEIPNDKIFKLNIVVF